ncbi:hypothetical protein [Microbacterium paulum]
MSDMAQGYLRGGGLEDVIDEAGLVDDAMAALSSISADKRTINPGRPEPRVPRALVARMCRLGTARVHAVGVLTLEDLRRRWLMRNT